MAITNSKDCNLIFYTNPMSRGQIVRWMLEETGKPYQMEVLEYNASMKDPEYLKINPLGKVPSIVHNGKVVTECAAICAYLADVFPECGLAPSVTDRADYYRWLFFAAGPLEAAVINRTLGFDVPQEKERMVGYGTYDAAVDTLAKAVTTHEYIAGSEFTAADVYVGSHVIWGQQFGSLPKRKAFQDYAEKLMQRPAYKAAQEK